MTRPLPLRFLECRIPPPLVGASLAGGMWLLSDSVPGLPLSAGWARVLAALLLATGLTLDLLGLLAFRARRTTINPLRPERSSAVVDTGVYRITRNPMYLGMALVLLAWAVYLGAVAGLAGPALFVLYITHFQIRPEERVLQERFGQPYIDYCQRVRRWI